MNLTARSLGDDEGRDGLEECRRSQTGLTSAFHPLRNSGTPNFGDAEFWANFGDAANFGRILGTRANFGDARILGTNFGDAEFWGRNTN